MRPRRHLRRDGAGRGPEVRAARGRGPGRLLDRAVYRQPAVRHANVLCTPHLGASTEEAQTKVAVEAAS